MRPWNVVITCRRNAERGALRELGCFGSFHPMGYKDVLVGFVEDRPVFYDVLLRTREIGDRVWRHIARLVPVDETFSFTLETFRDRLAEKIAGIAPRISPGLFYVRIERRGHKGQIPTPDIEREMGGIVIAAHERDGRASRVDFNDFRSVVAVETFGDAGGIGIVSREEMEKYPFIRVP